MDRLRKAGSFYWTLALGTPGYVWRAADVTGRIAFLFVVVLTLVFGVRGEIPIWLLTGIALAVVFVALLAANYDRFAGLESSLQAVKVNLEGLGKDYVASTRYMVAVDQLLHGVIDGTRLLSDLHEAIKAGGGSRPELRTRVDGWESATEAAIAKWCDQSELDFYRRPLAAVVLTGALEQDLFEQVDVRLGRLIAVQERKRQAMDKWLESG